MLNHHPAEGETPSYKGSMMLVMGENEAEVRELLAKDIYATSGVWDLENAQIIPVRVVFSSYVWSMLIISGGFSSSLLFASSCDWD